MSEFLIQTSQVMNVITPDDDYHLRIVSLRGSESRYRSKIDNFLDDLFNMGSSGNFTVDAPLELRDYTISAHAGRPAVLIRLQLSQGSESFTFDTAVADLCKRIFDPRAYSILGGMSSKSVIGFSAVSRTFKKHWTQSFFRQMLTDGPTFLRRIDEAFDDEYLPNWALVSSFASLAGLNFLGYRDSGWNDAQATETFGNAGITIATAILVKFATRTAMASPVLQQKKWDACYSDFKLRIEVVVNAIALATNPRSNSYLYGRNNEDSNADLCESLFDATVAAAKVYTANQDLLNAYAVLRKKAAISMVTNGVAAAVCLTNLGSAFALTTTTTVLPLAQWGLMDAAALLFLGEVPIQTITTLWVCPPLALLIVGGAAIGALMSYRDRQEKAKFQRKIDYHLKLTPFMARAWGLANDTHDLLRWIHCTDAANPKLVDFVDDNARLKWFEFISRVNRTIGRRTGIHEFEARHILIYLDEQRRDFENTHRALKTLASQL